MPKTFKRITYLVICASTAVSCAYRLGYSERVVPGGYTQIAIPTFKNYSNDVAMETYFTNSLRAAFLRSKVARVVDKNEAPVVLEGVIDKIQYGLGGLEEGQRRDTAVTEESSQNLPNRSVLRTDYTVLANVTIRLRRVSDGKILWTRQIAESKSYIAPRVTVADINSANALYNHSARHRTIQALAEDMMSDAHDRLTEQF